MLSDKRKNNRDIEMKKEKWETIRSYISRVAWTSKINRVCNKHEALTQNK